MKMLSDYKGEDALDILADIIEPLSVIFADEELQKLQKEQKAGKKIAPIAFIKPAIKNHKEEVNIMALPLQILSIVNDPMVKSLFHSQSQTSNTSSASSGSAIANTEAGKN